MITTIRRAELFDIDWILGELKIFSKAIETKYELYGDEKYSKDGLEMLIKNHIVFIAECDSERIGFVAGYFTPHLFNPQIKILSELFWWTVPKYRRKGVGAMLMDEFIMFGEKNAQWIAFSLTWMTKFSDSSLLKRGFKPYENVFLKEA